jgi:hypothetical protein
MNATHLNQGHANPLTPQEIALARNIATSIRSQLTHLGLCYQTKGGDVVQVSFRGHGFTPDRRYWAGEIDMNSLPPKVSVKKLAHPDTLHHLTATLGTKVRRLNTVGLTYCIDQQPPQRLPRQVKLDWKTHPPPRDGDGRPRYIFAIGQSPSGPSYLSLHDTNHILVGGATRMGKTTFLNAMLSSLLRYRPGELNVAFVDPKGVEFNVWSGIPHQIAPIAEEAHQALALFKALVREMERRRQTFKRVKARNLAQCNARLASAGETPLPMILVLVDELTDLSLVDDRIYLPLTRLASKGAAFGITLVLSTQNPKFEYVPTGIRGNLSTRVAFYVSSSTHSRMILGQNVDGRGAHQLPRIKGRFLLRYNLDLVEHQGFYVSDAVSEQIADRLRASDLPPARQLLLQDEQPYASDPDTPFPLREENRAPQQPTDRPLPELTEQEWNMVRLAVDELNGEFAVGRLYDRLDGISKNDINTLGQQLQEDGWLLPGRGSRPRRCTKALMNAVTER